MQLEFAVAGLYTAQALYQTMKTPGKSQTNGRAITVLIFLGIAQILWLIRMWGAATRILDSDQLMSELLDTAIPEHHATSDKLRMSLVTIAERFGPTAFKCDWCISPKANELNAAHYSVYSMSTLLELFAARLAGVWIASIMSQDLMVWRSQVLLISLLAFTWQSYTLIWWPKLKFGGYVSALIIEAFVFTLCTVALCLLERHILVSRRQDSVESIVSKLNTIAKRSGEALAVAVRLQHAIVRNDAYLNSQRSFQRAKDTRREKALDFVRHNENEQPSEDSVVEHNWFSLGETVLVESAPDGSTSWINYRGTSRDGQVSVTEALTST